MATAITTCWKSLWAAKKRTSTTGMVLDLKELKEIMEREVMERMDHRFLNHEVPELAGQIPTCENVAAVIWRLLEL